MQRVSFGVSRGTPIKPSQPEGAGGGGTRGESQGESPPVLHWAHLSHTRLHSPPTSQTPNPRPSIPHPSRQPRPPPTGDSQPPPTSTQPLPPFNPGDGWPSPATPGYGWVLVRWRRLNELHNAQAGGLKRGREGRAPEEKEARSRQDEEKQREEGRKAQTGERRAGQTKRSRRSKVQAGTQPQHPHILPLSTPRRGGHQPRRTA